MGAEVGCVQKGVDNVLNPCFLTYKKGDTLKCLPFLYGTAFLHGAIPDDNNPHHKLGRQLESSRLSS